MGTHAVVVGGSFPRNIRVFESQGLCLMVFNYLDNRVTDKMLVFAVKTC